jgi:RNA-directed DNA polymerase
VAAVAKRTIKRQFGPDHVVVEADLQGFVDHSRHDWRSRMWQERLEDGALRRLMRQGLKAGGLATAGQGIHPATGTPHGGVLSPPRAHVDRH